VASLQKPNRQIFKLFYIFSVMKRTTVIHTLNDLPKEFDLDEFLERLVIIEKIEEGLEDAKTGKTIPHDKVKKLVNKWHK